MNYKKIYDQIVERAKLRGLNKKKLEGYHEKHHIIPKCLGGTNDNDNLVLLTGREHCICHYLLWKSNKTNINLMYSFNAMTFKSKNTKGRNLIRLTSKQYELLRKQHNEDVRERMKGRFVSEETKMKIKEARSRQIITDETKQKISVAHKQIVHTEEWNKKVGESLKGYKHSENHINKNRAAHIGKKYSAETNAKKGSKGSTNPSARKCKINNMEFGCLKDAVKYANEILLIPKKRVYKMFNDVNEINFVKC